MFVSHVNLIIIYRVLTDKKRLYHGTHVLFLIIDVVKRDLTFTNELTQLPGLGEWQLALTCLKLILTNFSFHIQQTSNVLNL